MITPIVFLVGIDHAIQHDYKAGKNRIELIHRFSIFLQGKVKELNIAILAEEFSTDNLIGNHVKESTLQKIAADSGVMQIFCDPTRDEKEKHKIEKHDLDKREQFWLNRLQKYSDERILFICGDDHLESFSDKLKHAGYQIEILECNWVKSIPPDPPWE